MTTTFNNKMSDSPINLEELKSKLILEHANTETKRSGFPTEIISLPSKGLLYLEGSPLRQGKIEMKYMTAVEEEILATPSYMKNGVAMDKLFQALIVTPIKYNDLIEADKDAIMVAARMLGYGPDYETKCTCPICLTSDVPYTFNLNGLKEKEFSLDSIDLVGINEFKYTLPVTKRELTFKLLTHGDQQKIDLELEAINRKNVNGINKELTTKLKHMILSVDGDYTKTTINAFVDNEFFAKDSHSFRNYIKSISPSIDFTVEFNCKHCLGTSEMKLPIGLDFFWPGA